MNPDRSRQRRERRFGGVPQLDPAEKFLRPRLQRDFDAIEAEHFVDLLGHRDELLELAVQLLRRAVNMRVVLGEGAHAGQAGKNARRLETMQPAKIGIANRQIAVGIFLRARTDNNAPDSSSALRRTRRRARS